MTAVLPLLFALLADPLPAPARVLEVRPDGSLIDPKAPPPVRTSTAAPLPVEYLGRTIVLSKGETVWLRASGGRKIVRVAVDREGIVEAKGIDPSTVQLRAVETGAVKLTVETKD
jgi:hypothetical protein